MSWVHCSYLQHPPRVMEVNRLTEADQCVPERLLCLQFCRLELLAGPRAQRMQSLQTQKFWWQCKRQLMMPTLMRAAPGLFEV